MLLTEFRDLLLTADANATHYDHKGDKNYTTWTEFAANRLTGDDSGQERAWNIQIDRFTSIEYDPVADAITAVLEAHCIAYEYKLDYEPENRTIHHIWDCEVA